MIKRCLFICSMLLSSLFVFAQEKNAVHIMDFDLGRGEGQLSFSTGLITSGEAWCPFVMYIYDDEIYVLDQLHSRITVYTLSGSFIRHINVAPTRFIYASYMRIENDIIFLYTSNSNDGIGFLTIDGEFLFKINFNSFTEKHRIRYCDFHVVEKYIIFSNESGVSDIYDFNGNIVDVTIEELLKGYPNAQNTPEFLAKVRDAKIPNRILISNDRMYTKGLEYHLQLFEAVNPSSDNSKKINDHQLGGFTLMGSDQDNNYYWRASPQNILNEWFVVVTSKWGEVLEAFSEPLEKKRKANFSPSSTGDIYYFVADKKKISLWKTKRDW